MTNVLLVHILSDREDPVALLPRLGNLRRMDLTGFTHMAIPVPETLPDDICYKLNPKTYDDRGTF